MSSEPEEQLDQVRHDDDDDDDDVAIVPSPAEVGWIGAPRERSARRRRDKSFVPVMGLSLLLHSAAFAAIVGYGAYAMVFPDVSVDGGAGVSLGSSSATAPEELTTNPIDAIGELPTESTVQEPQETSELSIAFDESITEIETGDQFAAAESAADMIGLGASPARQPFGFPAAASLASPNHSRAAPNSVASRTNEAPPSTANGDGVAIGPPSPDAANRPPAYPGEARRRGWEGTVVLDVEVLPAGDTGRIVVARSSGHSILDDAAMDAVRHWRFRPARTASGQQLEKRCNVTLPINFVLRASRTG